MDEITTRRLRLGRLTPEHRPALFAMLSDLQVVRNLSKWPHPPDPAMIESLMEDHQKETPGGYAIYAGDALAGMISRGPRIGYFAAPAFWGQGIMTEALGAVTAKAARAHEILWSGAFEDNAASLRVLEKCGWREIPGGLEFSTARGRDVRERSFIFARRYDWLDPIKTARLRLRPLGPQDFEAIWEMASDYDVVKMTATWPAEPDEAFTKARLKSGFARAGLVSAVERNGEVIGTVACTGDEIGYMFRRAFWGQGFASEAVAAKVARAFADPALMQLKAGTCHDNPASIAVLRKCGFEEIGRGAAFCRARGELVEGPELELTRARWEALS